MSHDPSINLIRYLMNVSYISNIFIIMRWCKRNQDTRLRSKNFLLDLG